MPALALVTRDMLHRGTLRFTDELGKAGVMHSMPARRIKTDYADMGAEGEDMVGIAAAIGVVTAGRDFALVVEQPIEHVRGFAGGRRDHLGVERRVSVEEVRVELDPGFIAVMGIDGWYA
jgi:hypothetical protein